MCVNFERDVRYPLPRREPRGSQRRCSVGREAAGSEAGASQNRPAQARRLPHRHDRQADP